MIGFHPQVYDLLSRVKLHGNVRELENIIRQALVLKESGTQLEITDLPEELISQAVPKTMSEESFIPAEAAEALGRMLTEGQVDLSDLVESFEKTLITEAMGCWKNTQSELAQRLGFTRRTFYNKLQKYSIAQTSRS